VRLDIKLKASNMPTREKNSALKVNSTDPLKASALDGDTFTDSGSTKDQLAFFQMLQAKKALGLINDETIKAVTKSSSVHEKLTIQILTRLNKYSDFDSRWLQISLLFGSKNRYQIASSLADKYIRSASAKLVLSEFTGTESAQLGDIGLSEVQADLSQSVANVVNPMLAQED
jgi:hypothetical protein